MSNVIDGNAAQNVCSHIAGIYTQNRYNARASLISCKVPHKNKVVKGNTLVIVIVSE